MRPKIYYPKYQIQENLYTDGKEWQTLDGVEYIGPYHRYTDGTVLTESVYSPLLSKNLEPYKEAVTSNSTIYDTLRPRVDYISPYYAAPVPTKEDFTNGLMFRYLLRPRNDKTSSSIIEIDKTQFDSWKVPKTGISEVLYDAIQIEWKLTGPEYDVDVNGLKVYGVRDTNFRILNLYEPVFSGVRNYLSNLVEYSVYDPLKKT